jgi:hypothetical protein
LNVMLACTQICDIMDCLSSGKTTNTCKVFKTLQNVLQSEDERSNM